MLILTALYIIRPTISNKVEYMSMFLI